MNRLDLWFCITSVLLFFGYEVSCTVSRIPVDILPGFVRKSKAARAHRTQNNVKDQPWVILEKNSIKGLGLIVGRS